MNIGDYVRTKDYGFIRIKDCYIEDGNLCITDYNNNGYDFQIEEFKKYKSSPNIIDLIEEGDYVNGDRVVEHAHESGRLFVENVYVGGKGQTTIEDYSYELTSKYCYDESDFIKSIVTKEQFESMEYKIGDKE